MAKVLVLYYSMYGHVETLAQSMRKGLGLWRVWKSTIKRVPDTMSPEVAAKAGAKLDQAAPVADPKELGNYDAIIFGTPTRFGNMAGQMRTFLDQTGGCGSKVRSSESLAVSSQAPEQAAAMKARSSVSCPH